MASILVIDDDLAVQGFIQTALERRAHVVRCVNEGSAGIKAHRTDPAHIILCDLYMPGREGLETIRELRHEFPGVKVIAMSGGSLLVPGADLLGIALRLGAVAALHKPFSPLQLFETVDIALSANDSG